MAETQALVCPNCGGAVQLRGLGQALSAVCVQCLSILDTTTPALRIIQQFHVRERATPLIPLGTRGKLHGDPYEIIGFQTRQIEVDSVPYEWREYVLFNPYKGFRYLSEYDGHWNDIKPIKGIPAEKTGRKGHREVVWLNETYRHFQTASAETTYVMGEFPWKVMVGEVAIVEDFVSPPRSLSVERTHTDVTWSLGEYITPARLKEAFQLSEPLPEPKGIYSNQPSPYASEVATTWWTAIWLLGALAIVVFLCSMLMGQEEVFRRHYTYTPGVQTEQSFVTEIFDLDGRTSNVELNIDTDLSNNWVYFNVALINDDSGEAFDFGREVSYYFGTDSDGSWTEGSRSDRALIPSIPAGHYYLRIEPESDPAAQARPAVHYDVSLRRDVPYNLPFIFAGLLILVPPIIRTLRQASFESRRWRESDYSGSDGDDDDGDDE